MRKKSPRRKCKEGMEHTWMFDSEDESGQVWECMFCGVVLRLTKRTLEFRET